MTIQELLNGVIYAGTLASAVAAIMGLLHFGLVRPLRNFLRSEIVDGLTDIRHAVELLTQGTDDVRRRLDDHIEHGGHLSH
jgi:hypothetical protein